MGLKIMCGNGGLYKITNKITGKMYIGITTRDINIRFNEHLNSSGGTYFHNSISKHGKCNFHIETLVISNDWDYLCELEKKAIIVYNTLSPNGYNSTLGGDGVIGLCGTAKIKHKINTSIGTKLAWESGSLRENRAIAFSSSEFKKNHSLKTRNGTKKAYENPEVIANLRTANSNPQKRMGLSAHMKTKWSNPEYAEIQKEKLCIARSNKTRESHRKQGDSLRLTLANKPKVKCPYCDKIGAQSNMTRWHFDNCKKKV